MLYVRDHEKDLFIADPFLNVDPSENIDEFFDELDELPQNSQEDDYDDIFYYLFPNAKNAEDIDYELDCISCD